MFKPHRLIHPFDITIYYKHFNNLTYLTTLTHPFNHIINLVGGFNQPLWKMMEFVSWDDKIPNIWENKPLTSNHYIPTSNLFLITILFIPWDPSDPLLWPSHEEHPLREVNVDLLVLTAGHGLNGFHQDTHQPWHQRWTPRNLAMEISMFYIVLWWIYGCFMGFYWDLIGNHNLIARQIIMHHLFQWAIYSKLFLLATSGDGGLLEEFYGWHPCFWTPNIGGFL